jgi:protein involved in polysaccharide export with SLBB domain
VKLLALRAINIIIFSPKSVLSKYRARFMSYKKLGIVLSLIIIVLTAGNFRIYAQAIPSNLSNVNINDYSDSQIRQLLAQAQSSGLTDSQLIEQAKARGLSDDQAQQLEKRIADIRSKDGNKITSGSDSLSTNGTSTRRRLNYADSSLRQKPYTEPYDSLTNKIFGANLFRNKNIKFEPNLKIATPVNYVVGPEDQLNINVYGKSVANWKPEVSPDGNINIPGVGIMNVAGRTIEQVTGMIKSKLTANNYAIGNGTSVSVTLGNIRSIKVILVGQVIRPGTYTLPSLATVFNALYAAGGPNDNGSFRQIAIIRNNRIIRHLDVYDFLTKGDQKDNINLQDQDIIQVPTYRTRVEFAGAVKIPGLFEALPGESLDDMLRFAGGFTDQAYTALIKVIQISDQQKRITDVLENDFKSYVPLRGDKYIVSKILNRYENRVIISGAVFRPGEYEQDKGLTISGLINKAAGLKEDAFNGRGSITRLKPDNTKELISFNFRNIKNKTEPDILLQREDSVSMTSLFDLRDRYTVSIKGEVRKPGDFTYADSMTVSDLIIKAGGFAEGASPRRIEVARRVSNSDPTSKNNIVAQVYSVNIDASLKALDAGFTLHPFDIVSVYTLPGYEKQRTVRVNGEVLYPGYYTIETKNDKISDIIKRAGGLTASADVDGGTLKRSNIAILGVDKNKADTTEIRNERLLQITRLKKNSRDSTVTDSNTLRNNYVGIDLKRILEQPGSSIDLLVEDGDEIRIPKQQQIVRVNGEVLYPSAVVYSNNKNFNDYVLNAGGFAPRALKRRAYIVYPNGTVKGTRKVFFFNSHPKVRPGSEIYVPRKPEPKTNTGQQILGYASGLATLGAIIFEIISLSK